MQKRILESKRKNAIEHKTELAAQIKITEENLKKLRNEHYEWLLVQEECERKLIPVTKLPPYKPATKTKTNPVITNLQQAAKDFAAMSAEDQQIFINKLQELEGGETDKSTE